MKISLAWLKDFVVLPKNVSPQEIAERLTMTTVEVETCSDIGRQFDQMVVGKIMTIKPHPNADKLRLALTDVGGEVKQIVCGGTNLYEGMLVAVALPGATVKWHGEGEPVVLAVAKIRGEESFGMICAAEEVGLAEYLPAQPGEIMNLSFSKTTPGTPLATALSLQDVIFSIDNKSLTNRPDLWGHYGLARELAAIYTCQLKPLNSGEIESKTDKHLKVKVAVPAVCRRYISVVISGIKVGPSPLWLKQRLAVIGQKSINNIVDLTNYVMFETGQPLHAFDIRNLEGKQIVVREAAKGDKLVTLDNESVTLSAGDVVIADAKRPVALAGVIGGQHSGISDDTTEVVLEAASFDPVSIRKTAKKFNIRTESAIRFEKGIDTDRALAGAERFLELLKDIMPETTTGKVIDIYKQKMKPVVIRTDIGFINDRLGKNLSKDEITDILERLGFIVKAKGEQLTVTVPSYRAVNDVTVPEDLIEEVARIHGYDNITHVLPTVQLSPLRVTDLQRLQRQLRSYFSGSYGFFETINYSFVNDDIVTLGYELTDCVKLKNSLSTDLAILRPSLLPGLLENIEHNERWAKNFKLYEIGRIFRLDRPGDYPRGGHLTGQLPWQHYWLTAVISGRPDEVFFQAKGYAEAICRDLQLTDWQFTAAPEKKQFAPGSLQLEVGGRKVGYVFSVPAALLQGHGIEQSVGVIEMDLEELLPAVRFGHSYEPLPRYPSIVYDLAVVFPRSVAWQDVRAVVSQHSSLLKRVDVFDVYTGGQVGPEEKSLAFSLEFAVPDRTLQSSEVEQEVNKILKVLEEKFNGRLRKN